LPVSSTGAGTVTLFPLESKNRPHPINATLMFALLERFGFFSFEDYIAETGFHNLLLKVLVQILDEIQLGWSSRFD
jgi:hypothetical protein